MQANNLDRVVEIQKRLKQIDKEIDMLIKIRPPERRFLNSHLGIPMSLKAIKQFKQKSQYTGKVELVYGYDYLDIEMTREDINALIDIRQKEKDALKAELAEL